MIDGVMVPDHVMWNSQERTTQCTSRTHIYPRIAQNARYYARGSRQRGPSPTAERYLAQRRLCLRKSGLDKN
jgi:hypothetical protein